MKANLFSRAAGILATPFQSVRLKRDPEKEGKQDSEAVVAYNRTSNWLPFVLLRFFIIRELKKFHPRGKLLDVGCGPGHLAIDISKRFPGLEVTGLDLLPDMIAFAEKNKKKASAVNVKFVLGDVASLPYDDEQFDVVVSSLSLHHWENPGQALGEIHRVLKTGGKLILMDTRRDCRWWFFYGLSFFQKFLTPAAIKRTNGAVGSIYSSYTSTELTGLLDSASFRNIVVNSNPGWMTALATK